MKVNYKDAAILSVLTAIGAVILAYSGYLFGWSDLVRGTSSVFIFSLTTLYFSFSYERWKKEKENENKRKGILKGIYKEIIERARYLQYYQSLNMKYDSPYFVRIAPFPNSAWESAISNAYYDPEDQSWVDYAYIYNATDNVHLNLNSASEIAMKSTVPPEVRDKQLTSIYQLVQSSILEIMVIIDESVKKLEKELSISHDEVLRINEEIQKRIKATLESH